MGFYHDPDIGTYHLQEVKAPRVVPAHQRHKWNRIPQRGQTAVCLKCGCQKCCPPELRNGVPPGRQHRDTYRTPGLYGPPGPSGTGRPHYPLADTKMSYTVLSGDCVLTLPTLAVAMVQAFVTSPPYWGLRDYGIAPTEWPEIRYAPMAGLPELVIPATTCCLGLEPTPEAFIGHLLHVFRLAAPALKADGTCWVNLGDSYANDTKWGGSTGGKHANGLHGESGIGRGKKTSGLPGKNLVGIPWRFAFAMQADGWYLRQDVIWAKPNPMPESVTDRCTKSHEYIFLFAKRQKYYFDNKAISEPCIADSYNGSSFTKGKTLTAKEAIKPVSRLERQAPESRNKRSVWTVATKPYSEAHFATFPPALIEPCILAGTRPGDVVCDMFSGSGTTGQEALRHGRSYIGMEAKPENVKLHHKRMRGLQVNLPLLPAA